MASRTHRLAAVTAGLTFLLILVGEFTAVSGSGATCGFRWPDCSGQFLPFGLPVHDFIEWFHRAFAGIVGFFILGTALALWQRYDDRWLRTIGILAVVLLPIQVLLGGVTVTLGGLFPTGYQPVTQAIHHLTALAIYAALVLGAIWSRRADTGHHPDRYDVSDAARLALVSLPFVLLLSRGTGPLLGLDFLTYTTPLHVLHHAVELVLFTGLLVALDRAYATEQTSSVGAMAVAIVVSIVLILLGVGVLPYDTTVQYGYYALVGLTAALLLYTRRIAARDEPGGVATT